MTRAWFLLVSLPFCLVAQEAGSGFELRGTASAQTVYSHELTEDPRNGGAATGGFRVMLYPTWKLNENWTVSGAVQVRSRPYYFEEFYTQGYGVKADILQANLTYSKSWQDRSLAVRIGQMSTAFGSYLLRYDDAANPLIDMPPAYGYYYKPVTSLGLAGVQVDGTIGRVDLRAQFVNSSPANRRSLLDRDQYGNWAGGAGYTITQGFRVGASVYRGPYLHREFAFYMPGEARPRDLPATALGIDGQWGRGPWIASGEWQRFQLDYRAIPTIHEHTGYGEVRRVLHPRWYAAARVAYLRSDAFEGYDIYEGVVGFRPNRQQLLKVGLETRRASEGGSLDHVFAVQLVTTFRAISLSRD